MGDTTRHEIRTLRRLGDRAYWCVDCDKQWGPYDRIDEGEECAVRVGREEPVRVLER
jgi:hypothetical protein